MQDTSYRFGSRLLVALLLGWAGLENGCAQPASSQTYHFSRPTDVALVCLKPAASGSVAFQAAALDECPLDATQPTLLAFVTNTDLYGLSVLDLSSQTAGEYLDPHPEVPGYSRIAVGDFPSVAVSSAVTGHVYTANRLSRDLGRVDPTNWQAIVRQPLPAIPADLVLADGEQGENAWVALPDLAAVLKVPLSPAEAFGDLDPTTDFDSLVLQDGSPLRLALSPDGKTLYATHGLRPYLSVVDLQTKTERRVPLAQACEDGLDNDGDGAIDGADRGCLSPHQAGESAFETGNECGNGLDDDGDGATDDADPGCDPQNDLVPACMDGVDNDGDGRIDLADRGCDHPADISEYSENPACSDGLDNDGDGLSDYPDDPDCQSANDHSEQSPCSDGLDNDDDGKADFPDDPDCSDREDLTEDWRPSGCQAVEKGDCDDGLDNDGDGKTDFPDDTECSGPLDNAETAARGSCDDCIDNDGDGLTDYPKDPDCWAPEADNETHPACDDGVDNDGDGLTDYPDDPGCFRRSDGQEAAAEPPRFEALAVSPDGRWIYIADAQNRQVLVVRADTLQVLNLPAGEGGPNAVDPLLQRLQLRGIPVGTLVNDMAFLQLTGRLVALLAEQSATAVLVDVSYPNPSEGQHALTGPATSPTPQSSLLDRPTLEAAGTSVELRSTLPDYVARLGEFSGPKDEDTVKKYYGIQFLGNPRQERSETWTVRYEGVIPNTARTGRIVASGGAAGNATATLHDPTVDFCALGIEEGDLLLLTVGSDLSATDFVCDFRVNIDNAQNQDTYKYKIALEYPIEQVTPDTLVFGPEGRALRQALSESGEIIGSLEEVAVLKSQVAAQCLPDKVEFAVRPKEQWVASGNLSGFLHNRVREGRLCRLRTEGAELQAFTGRAATARLLAPAVPLTACPIPAKDLDKLFEDRYFQNLAFRFRITPGCQPIPDTLPEQYQPAPVERDTAWKFTVVSGMTPQRVTLESTPSRVRVLQPRKRFLVVDSSGLLVSIYATESADDTVLMGIDAQYY